MMKETSSTVLLTILNMGKNEDGCSAVDACEWALGQVKEIREMFD